MSSGEINYLDNLKLRSLAEKFKIEILNVGTGIQAIQRTRFIVFDYPNSRFPRIHRIAALRYYKKYFRAHAHRIDKNGILDKEDPYPFVEVRTGSENISKILKIIEKSYKVLREP